MLHIRVWVSLLDSQSETEGTLRIKMPLSLRPLIHTCAVVLVACTATHSFLYINSRSKLGLHQDLLWPSTKPAMPQNLRSFRHLKNARKNKYRLFASDISAVLDSSRVSERKRVEGGEGSMSTCAPAIIPSSDGGQRDTLLPDISAKLKRIHFNFLSLHYFLVYIMYFTDKQGATYKILSWNFCSVEMWLFMMSGLNLWIIVL